MIILLTERKNEYEKEIVEILEKYGADHFSDKILSKKGGNLTAISLYKPTKLSLNTAVAIFLGKSIKFSRQIYPIGIIGICEDTNKLALSSFKKSNNAVITCGINNKNTITISSFGKSSVLVTLQRSVIDIKGNRIEPCEFKIKLSKQYLPYSVLAATAALILNGIKPNVF